MLHYAILSAIKGEAIAVFTWKNKHKNLR